VVQISFTEQVVRKSIRYQLTVKYECMLADKAIMDQGGVRFLWKAYS